MLCTLARTRLGKVGLLFWPVVPLTWTIRSSDSHPSAKFVDKDWQRASYAASCGLCGSGELLDFYHIFFECTLHSTHPTHPREDLQRSCIRLLRELVVLLVAAKDKFRHALRAQGMDWLATYLGDTVTRDVSLGIDQVDWASPVGRFLLYRTLLVLPWPARVTSNTSTGMEMALPGDPALVTRVLGTLFDSISVQHRYLRPLANKWVACASSLVYRHLLVWARAVDAARLPFPFGAPPAGS